jgi:hypothetical protein
MLSLASGSRPYAARAYDEGDEFEEGDRVIVLEEAGRVVYVAELAS